jgi:hypothetical protein
MSFTGALKLTRTSRPPLRLHAKRRTKLSKQASNGQQINQTQMSPPETVGDTQIPKANLEQGGEVFGVEVEVLQENSNPNAVKTAPLVIKKGGESFNTQADYDDSWGRVPDTQEPSTMRSIQARLGGEAPTSRLTTKNNARTIGASFQSDLDDFNDRMMAGADSRKQEMSGQEEAGIIKTVKDALSFIMVADFFVVIVFLVWFLAAAAMQKTDPWLLERFQDIFQPVVVPSLTVLMTGSIASGLLGDRKADD